MHYLGIFRLKFEKSFVAFNARKLFIKLGFIQKKIKILGPNLGIS